MKNYIHILFLLLGLLCVSCDSNRLYNYPKDTNISSKNGEPKDSLTFYLPTIFKSYGEGTETVIDTFLLQWYSSSLFAFKEPILYNYFLGHKSYRFLWLRTFHNPVVISIHKDGHIVWLSTKMLDRQPGFVPYRQDKLVFVTPDNVRIPVPESDNLFNTDRHANIIFTETKALSSAEWEKFDRILNSCKFWSMNPADREPGIDGSEWVIEAHLKGQYLFVFRHSPENCFWEIGKYLIDLSGLKEEIY